VKVTNKTSEVIELIREIAIRATSPYSEKRERLNLEDSLLDIRDYIDEILQTENSSESRRDEYSSERIEGRYEQKSHRPSNSRRPPRRRTQPKIDVDTRLEESRFGKTSPRRKPRVERYEKPPPPSRNRKRVVDDAGVDMETGKYVGGPLEEVVTEARD